MFFSNFHSTRSNIYKLLIKENNEYGRIKKNLEKYKKDNVFLMTEFKSFKLKLSKISKDSFKKLKNIKILDMIHRIEVKLEMTIELDNMIVV
ncbi:hypothetical protein BpHYR1_038645 [Brachionus plicatilis]|uniref:Uncharacterized protein n=1 Tax=Brachionus plicatilis TaxID=10195 RepID=A0A3M7PS45_BRAPC|nr:hypothetical protein BpHYR1_038645 [Brachionus plicatilis]